MTTGQGEGHLALSRPLLPSFLALCPHRPQPNSGPRALLSQDLPLCRWPLMDLTTRTLPSQMEGDQSLQGVVAGERAWGAEGWRQRSLQMGSRNVRTKSREGQGPSGKVGAEGPGVPHPERALAAILWLEEAAVALADPRVTQ